MAERFPARWMDVIRLVLAPITSLIATPIRLVQTLWASRILGNGRWEAFNRFTARSGLNSTFYWTMALNLDRYGRRGTSPELGTGAFLLHRWASHCLAPLYAYWRLAPVVPLVGMFGWLGAHAVWTVHVAPGWVGIVVALAATSTAFYANTFVLQNYNALGWALFPIFVFGLLVGNPWITAVSLLLASFVSPTAVAIGAVLASAVAIASASLGPVIACIPAIVKLSTHFAAPISAGAKEARAGFVAMLHAIGVTGTGARYRVKRQLWVTDLYFLVIYLQFPAALYLFDGRLAVLTIVGILLYVVNTAVSRFADPQSLMMTVMTTAIAETMVADDPRILASLWILVAPAPLFLNLPRTGRLIIDIVPPYRPFDISGIATGIRAFLAPASEGERVLMAFEDPGNDFGRVFDGYSVLYQLPHYIACQRRVHLFPDFWAVTELNYEGSPSPWGRDIASVTRNARDWRARHVIVYTVDDQALEEVWAAAGYEVEAKFSWRDYADLLRGEDFGAPLPVWWLLRVPKGDDIDVPSVA